MKSSELLYELKNAIKKAIYLQIYYTCQKEMIVDNQIIKADYNKKQKLTLEELDLGQIQFKEGNINCETCQEYNYTKDKINSIKGYVESTIVICKLNNNEYKIDSYMKQVDNETNLEYDTNIQYKIILIFA